MLSRPAIRYEKYAARQRAAKAFAINRNVQPAPLYVMYAMPQGVGKWWWWWWMVIRPSTIPIQSHPIPTNEPVPVPVPSKGGVGALIMIKPNSAQIQGASRIGYPKSCREKWGNKRKESG